MTEKTLTQQVNSVLATLTGDIKNNKLELPSPPDLLIKVRSLASSSITTIDNIVELVKQDPHISGRLIKVANCALFGSRGHVTNVKAAISRLGLARVQNLIIGLSIAQNMMKAKTLGLEDLFNQCWQQSNRVAAISYVLAQKKSDIDPDQALLAGMVHNIGTLPLILRLNNIDELKTNVKVLKMVADVVVPKLYAKAGKLVMESWNFSPDIASIALSHCDLDREYGEEISLDDIILVSHQLSLQEDYIDIANTHPKLIDSSSFKKLWNSADEAEKELANFSEDIDQMKQDITS